VDVLNRHNRDRLRRHRPDIGGPDVINIDTLKDVGSKFEIALVDSRSARDAQRSVVEKIREDVRSILECLAVEKPSDEKVTLFPEREFIIKIDFRVLRQEPLALEFDKRCCDEKEFRRDLQIEMLELLNLHQIGVDDPGQGDLIEIHLLPKNQVEQEIKGTLEDGRLNLVWHRVTIEAPGRVPVHSIPTIK
jgi:hypothetical protein